MATQLKPKYNKIRPQDNPSRNGDFTRDTLPPEFSGAGDRVIKPPLKINVNKPGTKASGFEQVEPKKMTFVAKKR